MDDVTKYKPAIQKLLAKLRIKKHELQDMEQECYLALLENPDTPEDKIENLLINWVTRIKMGWSNAGKTVSLSSPGIHNQAARVRIPEVGEISEPQLQEAIVRLPYEIYQVVYSRYVEGQTEEKTAADLSISRQTVHNRTKRGVAMLRKILEV